MSDVVEYFETHPLCSPGESNAKTRKNSKGYEALILYLAPADTFNGRRTVCPYATKGCKSLCLGRYSGRMVMSPVQAAQNRRTDLFFNHRADFLRFLRRDLRKLEARAARKRRAPIARLNGTSDIRWERFGIPQEFPGVTFYDYTKDAGRYAAFLRGELPSNVHLTFSAHENMPAGDVEALCNAGGTVAIAFHGGELPATYAGVAVRNGDASDWRFEDPAGVVVGLLAKGGAAKRDTSGFVRWAE